MEGNVEFAEFWKLWPRKCSKKRANLIWDRLSEEERIEAIKALPFHVKHWRESGTETQFIPHASTWLYGARWEDELPVIQSSYEVLGQEKEACDVCDGSGWAWIKGRVFRARCKHGERLSSSIALAPMLVVNNS